MCTFHLHQDSGKAGHPLDARPHGGRRGPCHQSKKFTGDDHRAIDVGPELRTWPGQRPSGEARLVHGFLGDLHILCYHSQRPEEEVTLGV